MLANDPDNARQLIAKAEAAGGASDSKFAANIALLNKLAPESESKPAKTAEAAPVETGTAVKPAAPVTAAALPAPQSAAPQPAAPKAEGMPHAIVPAAQQTQSQPQLQPQKTAVNPVQASGVVMQAVPVDPKAGPVKSPAVPAKPAAPGNLANTAPSTPPRIATAEPPKPVAAITAAITAVSEAKANNAPVLPPIVPPVVQAAMEPPRIVIADAPKPVAVNEAKANSTPVVPAVVPAAPVPPRIVIASQPTTDSKPGVKTADAKPVEVKASKDDVPALRLTADARSP
jgi:hypothetical protein